MSNIFITPNIKIKELINNFPEIEFIILDLIPSLKSISSARVRESIYTVTSLDTAAKSANLDISTIINTLREKVGQNTMSINNTVAPIWAKEETAKNILDARPIIAAGEHPLTEFMELVSGLNDGEVILLITPFLPGPLIEKSIERGLNNYTDKQADNLYYNYFQK